MTPTTSTLTLRDMPVPAALDVPESADFLAVIDLYNAVSREATGVSHLDATPTEMLPYWQTSADRVFRTVVAEEDGRLVGALEMNHATAEPTSIEAELMVLTENWGRGIEDALLAELDRSAREMGRKVIQLWSMHRADPPGETLSPATGWGRIDAGPVAALLQRHGFALEQIERNSILPRSTPMQGIRQLLEDALAIAGDDYRLRLWTAPTPAECRDDYAWAMSRMSTDVPSAGLDVDEETWDADRLMRREQRILSGGNTLSVAVIEHVPSGTIAAFNELVTENDGTGATDQYGTLVLKEHRGHRLGMIVKCANILRWHETVPGSPLITTFNAEENRPMLDINEAIGFTPAACAAAWQKRLD